MKPLDHPLLCDENIHPDVVRALCEQGHDVTDVRSLGLIGSGDEAILSRAHQARRVVLTHDGDFGTLAVARGVPYTGIVYLRPGHIAPGFVLEIPDAIRRLAPEVEGPILIVAERRAHSVRVRLRVHRAGEDRSTTQCRASPRGLRCRPPAPCCTRSAAERPGFRLAAAEAGGE